MKDNREDIPISELPRIMDAIGFEWRDPREKNKQLNDLVKEKKLGSTVNYELKTVNYELKRE